MSDQPENLVEVAQASFAQLSTFTSPHLTQVQELRASGVSEQRIAALYPFNLAEHAEPIVALLNDDARYTHLHATLVGTSNSDFALMGSAAITWVNEQMADFLAHPALNSLKARPRADSTIKPRDAAVNWARLLLFFALLAHEGTIYNRTSLLTAMACKHRARAVNELGSYFAIYPLPGAFEDLTIASVLGR